MKTNQELCFTFEALPKMKETAVCRYCVQIFCVKMLSLKTEAGIVEVM